MADRIGKCTNYSSCKLAYRNEPITVSGDLICPECGQPLQELAGEKKSSKIPIIAIIAGAGALALIFFVLVVGVLFTQCLRKPKPQVADGSTPTPEVVEESMDAEPTPGEAFTFGSGMDDTATPAAETTPEPTPEEPVEVAETTDETIVVEPSTDFDTDPDATVNQATHEEVLRRIEAKKDLSDDERDRLYTLVDRARGFGRIITIGFASGKKSLSASDVDALKKVLLDPNVRHYTDDPTAVLVILGFADRRGDETANLKLSQERADAVMQALEEKCGVQNIMHSVAMGATNVFDTEDLETNRVVEAWVVQP